MEEAPKKFKNHPRPFFRPRSIHSICRLKPNPSDEWWPSPFKSQFPLGSLPDGQTLWKPKLVGELINSVWCSLKFPPYPSAHTVERLYCKRPIQCLASTKILTPHRPPPGECVPPAFGAGGGHTRWVERGVGGGQYFGRRQTQLCTLHI